MSDDGAIPCPFTYANGKRCSGTIYRARAYGSDGTIARHKVRKYRLWCSDRDDHAGADKSYSAKERMEFYPDELPEAQRERISKLAD